MLTLKVPGLKSPLATKFIIWVQGSDNYTWVHLASGKSHLITQTLKWFEDRLTQFMRISKSALVNPRYASLVKRDTSKKAQLILNNGLELLISRRRIEEVINRISADYSPL